MAEDDANLVRAAIRGEDEAFRVLVERHASMVAAIAYAVTGDAEAARDLAQEAFAEAYRSLRRLRSAGKFAAWLAGIARRKSVSWVRARSKSREQPGIGAGEAPGPKDAGPPEETSRAEIRARVLGAVRGLPPGYREVIVLRCLEGKGHREIGSLLGISVAAVDKRLTRAKAMLREVLGDLVED